MLFRSGLGAAILPAVALPKKIDTSVYALKIVNPSMTRRVAIVTVRGQSLSPASLRLVELLKQLLPLAADQKIPRNMLSHRYPSRRSAHG